MSTTIGQRTGSNPVHLPDSVPGVDRVRYQRLAREMRLTLQMLTYDIDTLSIVDGGPAPAWTEIDGDAVTINAAKMPPLRTRKQIAVWLGTKAHELFHSLYTPRADTVLVRRLRAAQQSTAPTIWRTFNVLEDQRIERFGLARYGKWRGYLIAALSFHINPDADGAWLLLAGRTWLPAEARAIARATFAGQYDGATADYAAELIGSYQRLTDPACDDADEAYRIITEFDHAFRGDLPRGTCDGRPTVSGDCDDTEPGDDVVEQWPAADEPEPEADDEPEDGDDGEPEDGDDGDADADADDEGDDDGDGDDDDGDGDGEPGGSEGGDEPDDSDDDDEPGEGDAADGEAGGHGTGIPDGETHTLKDALSDAVDEALADDATADDLDRVVEQVENGTPGRAVDLDRKFGTWEDVTPAARLMARDVADVLAEIKDQCEAAWERRTDSGRFSVQRWATDPGWDADSAFDLFDPGAMDASSLDCTLLIDVSGSIGGANRAIAEATWAIRTAVDRVEGQCTVVGFGDDASLMFAPGSRPDGRLFIPHLEGSTNPTPACRVAHQMVTSSDAANRIVVVLTDGEWWNGEHAVEALRDCKAAGAIVAVLGWGGWARQVVPGFAGADVAQRINTPDEMVAVFREVTVRSMRQAAGLS